MKILDDYFKLQQEIYNYFGFKEDWRAIPIDDRRYYSWKIQNDDEVIFGNKDDILKENGNYYVDEIYKQRFYNKYVYIAEEYTMIIVDTHIDGNKFLAIYDNSKEIK